MSDSTKGLVGIANSGYYGLTGSSSSDTAITTVSTGSTSPSIWNEKLLEQLYHQYPPPPPVMETMPTPGELRSLEIAGLFKVLKIANGFLLLSYKHEGSGKPEVVFVDGMKELGEHITARLVRDYISGEDKKQAGEEQKAA